MWRAAMLYHQIAGVLGSSRETVEPLICERPPASELSAHTAGRLTDPRSSEERLRMRRAAALLAGPETDERRGARNASAIIDRWLAAHAAEGNRRGWLLPRLFGGGNHIAWSALHHRPSARPARGV